MAAKVTNNIPFQAGEGITQGLLNGLAASAQTGRLVSGDGSANVQMVGSTIGIGANLPFKNGDKDILAILRAPLPASSKTPALGAGMYYGSTFNQGLVLQDTTAPTLTIARPVPTMYNCIILNGSENLGTGHAISVDTPCVARFMGYSAPNAQGISFPLLFTRVEAVKFKARITAVTGSFPAWSYTVQKVIGYNSSLSNAARWVTDGVDITGVLNRCEFGGTPNYTYGTGNTITNTDGTVNSTSCKVVAIGIGAVPDCSVDVDANGNVLVTSFELQNSAQ
jgi:hypothetical protein